MRERIIDQLNEVYGERKAPSTIRELLLACSKEFLVKYLMFLDKELCKHQKALDRACEELTILVDCDKCPSVEKKCKTIRDCEDEWIRWFMR